jgi:outer membrane protein TolC
MRLSWLLLIAAPLVTPLVTLAQTPDRGVLQLSLKRAVELAAAPEGNAKIQLSGESLTQARARSAQARGALLPDFSAAWSKQSRTMNLAANGLSFNSFLSGLIPSGFSFPSFVGPFNTMDARVSGSQVLFDVAAYRRFQASKAGISAARSDVSAAEEQVAALVARAYLSAIRADADLETAKANVTLSQATLTQTENQKAAGTGTGIEITRAKVQLANDRQRLLVAQNALRSANLQLLRAVGLRLDTEIELTEKLKYAPVDEVALEQAKQQALKQRADLQAQQDREANARLSADATKMERLPTVAAMGDYGLSGSGFDKSGPTRTYGIAVKIPIFDGGRRDARRVETASQYRAEKIRSKDLKEQIELDVRLALDGLHSADEQVKVAKEGLDLAENELTQARRRYEAGITNSLEVTDAQTRLERARDNQTTALYSYNLARIDLAQAMGRVRDLIR